MMISSDVHDQGDAERRDQGGALLAESEECSNNNSIASPRSNNNIKAHRYVWASCALAVVVVTTTTTSMWSPQEHRRRLVSERELSIGSRMKEVFAGIVKFGFDDADDVGFDISTDTDEEDEGQCPGHDRYKGLYMEIPRIWTADLGAFGVDELTGNGGAADAQRTFMVEPNHTVLEGGKGVVFNVEVVPAARPEDASKTRLSQEEILLALKQEAGDFYGVEVTSRGRAKEDLLMESQPFIEAMSRTPTTTEDGGGTVFASGQGFLAACMTAFAYHLPLALSPDDLWIVIANGFARHVDHNAEELRANFVAHDGQKEIRIRADSMVKGESPPEQWEEHIFPQFSEGIARNVNNTELYETLALTNFSTSTVSSQAASEVILMATMKNYFKFGMDTMCGIPNIRLDGTRGDWEELREKTKTLAKWMLQNNTHGDLWVYDIVLPILDEFLHSYDGEPNYCFWQNMVKFRTSGSGSGSFDFLSGWLHTLFPYLSADGGTNRPNPYLKPWLQSASAHYLGPKPSEIPIQISSVPVQWMYYEQELQMHFHAGFRGVHQEADGTVRPIIGWYVTEDVAEEAEEP